MTAALGFPDWCSLSNAERAAAFAQCERRLQGIGRRLNAVEQIFPETFSNRGPLSGLPYVAKDMLATGRSAPSRGWFSPQAAALPRASIIESLEEDGAS